MLVSVVVLVVSVTLVMLVVVSVCAVEAGVDGNVVAGNGICGGDGVGGCAGVGVDVARGYVTDGCASFWV